MNIFLIALLISFPLWVLNLEFNPGMGHIWIRPDENGNKRFVPRNIINYLLQPFTNSYFWKPEMWDLNFYTFYLIILTFLGIYIFFTKKE